MKFIGILFVFCLVAGAVKAQETVVATAASLDIPKGTQIKLGKNDTIRVNVTNDNGHLEPWIIMPEVKINPIITRLDASQFLRVATNACGTLAIVVVIFHDRAAVSFP